MKIWEIDTKNGMMYLAAPNGETLLAVSADTALMLREEAETLIAADEMDTE